MSVIIVTQCGLITEARRNNRNIAVACEKMLRHHIYNATMDDVTVSACSKYARHDPLFEQLAEEFLDLGKIRSEKILAMGRNYPDAEGVVVSHHNSVVSIYNWSPALHPTSPSELHRLTLNNDDDWFIFGDELSLSKVDENFKEVLKNGTLSYIASIAKQKGIIATPIYTTF